MRRQRCARSNRLASLIHKRPTRPALWSSAANTQRQRRNFSSARTSCRHKENGGGHGIWKRRFTLVARRAATDHHTVGLVLALLAVRSRENAPALLERIVAPGH